MFSFPVTEIVNHIHQTYFNGIQQMGIENRSLSDNINSTLSAVTALAIQHCLSAWKTGQFMVLPGFGPGGGVQCKCDKRNINHTFDNAGRDVFRHLEINFRSLLPDVQAYTMDNLRSVICRRIHSTGTNPTIAQPHKDQGSVQENFLDYALEELTVQPDYSFNFLTSFFAATETSMQFSAVVPMGGSAIASSSQPIPCSNSNSNSNHITNITNITSIENTEVVDRSMIVEAVMLLGGYECCQ